MDEKIKSLRIIHLAMSAGTLLAYFLIGNLSLESFQMPELTSTSFVYFAIPIVAFLLSNFLFKSNLKQADTKNKWQDNLGVYQTACIIRWGILEGAALLILFFKPDLLLLGVLVILYLFFLHPTEDRIKQDLQRS